MLISGSHSFFRIVTLGLLTGLTALGAPNDLLIRSDFEHSHPVDYPWSGVDSMGRIKGILGAQLSVNSAGTIAQIGFSPCVAVGDLNGDGLPDLVVADAQGFFWYFANSGTKTTPKFTTPELMPLWFGDPFKNDFYPSGSESNVVPRIQLVDFDGDGKLDLVVGTFTGALYYVHNSGSATVPAFKMTVDRTQMTVPTSKSGNLWCNYLAPFLFDWGHQGHLDLLVGDGSYSANSIFLLTNKGTNDRPIFSEDAKTKIIPGMGREDLLPQVVDWNNDGKPDILSAERAGYINIFLNTSAPDAVAPTFADGQHVLLNGKDKISEYSTATVADLNGSKLPSLIVGTPNGLVSYAQNIGTPGNPKFGPLVPLMGVNTHPKILQPGGWHLEDGFGSPYDLLVCTNAQVEPGFTPPPDTPFTSALRFYIDEPSPPNPTFPEHFYPESNDIRLIACNNTTLLKAGVRYELSFWIRSTDDIRLSYALHVKDNGEGQAGAPDIVGALDTSPTWAPFKTTVQYEMGPDKRTLVRYGLYIVCHGKGSVYLDDVKLIEK